MRTIANTQPLNRAAARSLFAALPLLALVLPVAAHAGTAQNSASLTLPAGVTDPNTANNSATDSDNVLAALVATDDTVTGISAATGGSAVVNAFTGDTVNGVAASGANATLAVASGSSVPSGLTFNTTTGDVDVAAATAPGTYTFDYTLCEAANPTNCADATITVTVDPAIDPVTESGTGTAFTASTVIADVRANDFVNGVAATAANSTVSADPANPLPSGFSIDNASGAISIDNTVAAGTYDVWYQLCDLASPTPNCATVKDTVTVSNRQADLSLTKSNGVTEVTSGQTTTYTLTITNNGPDSVTGVIVTDTPGAGITCPATNALTFGGAAGGIPGGSFTVADLTGGGVTLATLADTESVTITFDCTVN